MNFVKFEIANLIPHYFYFNVKFIRRITLKKYYISLADIPFIDLVFHLVFAFAENNFSSRRNSSKKKHLSMFFPKFIHSNLLFLKFLSFYNFSKKNLKEQSYYYRTEKLIFCQRNNAIISAIVISAIGWPNDGRMVAE
ncbi:MAG: hypothetical protein U9Q16_02715 [Patescibacteria group bacterium]|nr:hypothetical protein [Patescibacteria group bacterium]